MTGIWISPAILLLLALAYLFAPGWLQIIAAAVLICGLGFAIASIVGNQILQYRLGQVDRRTAIRGGLIDIFRLAIGLSLSILLARRAAAHFIDGLSGIWGFVLGITAAMAIGIGINLLMRRLFSLS